MSHQDVMQQKIDAFRAAMETFIRRLGALEDADAQRRPADGGWTPAQIGWHVAANRLLAGDVPRAKPVPENFQQDPKALDRIPSKTVV